MEDKTIKYTKSIGGIVVNKERLILVVNQDGNSWSLPKGHPEKNELDIETARREIYEESGITNLKLIKDLGSYQRTSLDDESEMKTIHMFLFKTDEDKLNSTDPGNPEAKWLNTKEVEKLLTHPKDKEFFRLHIADCGGL